MQRATLCLIAMLVWSGFGSTISGSQTLMLGQMMDLDKDSVIGKHWGQIDCSNPEADFFVAYDDACCLSTSCCCGLRVGAYSAIYFSLRPFDSTDFSAALDINDTTAFRVLDTLGQAASCPQLPSLLEPTDIGYPHPELIDSILNHFFIVRTREATYALVKMLRYNWRETLEARCIQGVDILWVLQTDGSTYFDMATSTRLTRGLSSCRHRTKASAAHEEHFGVNGRMLGTSRVRSRGVVITKRVVMPGVIRFAKHVAGQ